MRLIKEFEKMTQVHKPRGYLGCSIIGHPCDRYIWISKYGDVSVTCSFQKERIFDRGRLEEERIFNLIRKMKQIHLLSMQEEMKNGVLKGSCDAILKDGDGTFYILEIKTMHDKAFKELKRGGLAKSNPLYWAQCHAYMKLSGYIRKTIFLAVNKNDESMYEELIDYDPDLGDALLEKANRINDLTQMPEGSKSLSRKPQECFRCHFHQFCYGDPS